MRKIFCCFFKEKMLQDWESQDKTFFGPHLPTTKSVLINCIFPAKTPISTDKYMAAPVGNQ